MIKTNAKQSSYLEDGVAEMHDSKFMSAREKERVVKQWEAFLKNECARARFTKTLYTHLIMHCSFIAHYDINGFYDTYFTEGEDTARFLSQFDRSKGCRSVELGMTYWLTGEDYGDINSVMVNIAARYIPALTHAAQIQQRETDVKRAKALLAKHGIAIKEG